MEFLDLTKRATEERIISQFREKTNWTKLLGLLMAELQELDDATVDLEQKTLLAVAFGAHLDQYGELLDEQRAGLSDDEYRKVLRVRLQSDRSIATVEPLIQIVEELTDGELIVLLESYPCAIQIDFAVGTPLSDTRRQRLTRLVSRAKAAGVHLDWIAEAPLQYFGFYDDPNALGFGEGAWADVISG
jgi:hypothetical protein